MRITKSFHWHSRILEFSQCFQVASINDRQENTFEHKKSWSIRPVRKFPSQPLF